MKTMKIMTRRRYKKKIQEEDTIREDTIREDTIREDTIREDK
jgi:hypothetical protein